jgi:hypothetical protein
MCSSKCDISAKTLLLIPLGLLFIAVLLNWPELQRYARIERM